MWNDNQTPAWNIMMWACNKGAPEFVCKLVYRFISKLQLLYIKFLIYFKTGEWSHITVNRNV